MIYILNPYGTYENNSIASVIYNSVDLLPENTKVISYDLNKDRHPRYVCLFKTSSILYRAIKFLYQYIPYRIKSILFKRRYGFVRLDFIWYCYAVSFYLKNNIKKGDIIVLHAYPGILKQLSAFRKCAKIFMYLHNNDLEYHKNDLKCINEDSIGLYIKYSDGVILLNDKPYKELLKKEYYNTWVINNFVKAHDTAKTDNDRIDFIYSGRLVQQKYINELCSAFSQCFSESDPCKLYLAGGFDTDEYKEKILTRFSGKTNIVFMGKLNKKDLHKKQSIAKYTILISNSEGSPLSLLEGAALNNKLIASNIDGCREIINAYGGYLIDNEDIESNLKILFKKLKKGDDSDYIRQNPEYLNMFTSANYAYRFNSIIRFIETTS